MAADERGREEPGGEEPAALTDRGAGEADHLQRLWTPYRMSYLAEGPLKQNNANLSRSPTSRNCPTRTVWWWRAASWSTRC